MKSENLRTITKSACKKLPEYDVDMLSSLHDSVLCQIISKLELKEAAKTSVLSSRYKSLWKHNTSLRFNDWSFGNAWFADFLNSLLSSLISINILSLKLVALFEVYDVSFWFRAAICMNVKVLKLHIHEPQYKFQNRDISLPSCLYTSKTLEVLELCLCECNKLILNVPKFVSLPKLTKLELHHVDYSSDDSVRRLISGCSSLEELRITRNKYDNAGTFTIVCPTLKIFSYMFPSVIGSVKHDMFSSVIGSVKHDYKFELNAPALVDFRFEDETSREFSFVNLGSLEHAEIHVPSPTTGGIASQCKRVVQIIQKVYDVNHLWISGATLEALGHRGSPQQFSRRNLGDSRITMDTSKDYQNYFECNDDFSHLHLSKGSSDTTHVVQWREPEELPFCLLSCLETISVCGFRGRESEVGMIAYILENALMLKKMAIRKATSEAEANIALREKMLKFYQGSGRCTIIFS